MTDLPQRMTARVLVGLVAGLAMLVGVFAAEPTKQAYASADDAVAALVAAARSHDTVALRAVSRPGSAPLVTSGDRHADEATMGRFVEAYDAKHALVPECPDRMMVEVGSNDWQLPIRIVQREGRWYSDAREGAQEIVDRRIGRNEIAAIRVCLAYVDAQNDFF